MRIVGREDLIDEPWFADHTGRLEHADELDEVIQAWVGERTAEEVLDGFAEMEAAIAPIYSIADIFEDPHYEARETIATVAHPTLGPIRMQGVVPLLSLTPGRIRHPGPELGEHNEEIYGGELGLTDAELAELRREEVI
jgi:crotonobetainyl-CoA:carnitine CoA-transferase CaiB-like acyl-CoA transferase